MVPSYSAQQGADSEGWTGLRGSLSCHRAAGGKGQGSLSVAECTQEARGPSALLPQLHRIRVRILLLSGSLRPSL